MVPAIPLEPTGIRIGAATQRLIPSGVKADSFRVFSRANV
jgi:hypothetical protein